MTFFENNKPVQMSNGDNFASHIIIQTIDCKGEKKYE